MGGYAAPSSSSLGAVQASSAAAGAASVSATGSRRVVPAWLKEVLEQKQREEEQAKAKAKGKAKGGAGRAAGGAMAPGRGGWGGLLVAAGRPWLFVWLGVGWRCAPLFAGSMLACRG